MHLGLSGLSLFCERDWLLGTRAATRPRTSCATLTHERPGGRGGGTASPRGGEPELPAVDLARYDTLFGVARHRQAASEVAFLSRALKAPGLRELAASLAERAREESWSYEVYLAAVLGEEVAARESHGGEARVKAARFPQVKTLDDSTLASRGR